MDLLRRGTVAVREGLYRTLAEDDQRAAYWVRHVRTGVVLSVVVAAALGVYVLLTPSPAHDDPILLVLAPLVVVTSPALLLLPLADMVRDRRGRPCSSCGASPTRH